MLEGVLSDPGLDKVLRKVNRSPLAEWPKFGPFLPPDELSP